MCTRYYCNTRMTHMLRFECQAGDGGGCVPSQNNNNNNMVGVL